MKDFATRLKYILDTESLTATAFAERLGIQRSGLSHILSGRNNPSLDLIQRIHESFPEYSYTFLIDGKETDAAQTGIESATADNSNHDPDLEMNSSMANETEPISNPVDVTVVTNEKRLVRIVHYFDDGMFESFSPREGSSEK